MLSHAPESTNAQGLRWLGGSSRTYARYVGIDVGIDHVKVATLGAKTESFNSATAPEFGWLSQTEFPLPIDPAAPPPSDWVDLVAGVLDDRLPRCVDGDRNFAVLSLPTPWIHYQTTSQGELEATKHQCNEMFGASIFQSDAHVAAWPVVSSQGPLVIAATAESAARRIADSVARIGYRVQGILPHGVALLQSAPMLTSLTPWAVVVLEQTGGLVAIQSTSGCGLCRNLPACAIANGEQAYLDEIEPWLQEIALEVNATSRYAARMSGAHDKQSPILVCGRAAQIPGVDRALATLLGRPIAIWRYAGRTRPRHRSSILDPQHSDSSMAVSLSLAYCALQASDAAWRRKG